VLIGVADGDMDGADAGGHVDAGGGADAGGHLDAGGAGDVADVHTMESHGGMTVGGHMDGHTPHHGSSGFWQNCGRLLHLGEIPLMIVLSVLSLFMWFFSISANVLFNGEPGHRSSAMALVLLVPNLIVSLLLTRVILSPLRGVIRRMQSTESEVERVIGREGVVCTGELSDSFGQIEIAAKGVPLVVNARLVPGRPPIPKGTRVLVFESGPGDLYYLVSPAGPDALAE
jgi:Protein of unknown function (DUF1449)